MRKEIWNKRCSGAVTLYILPAAQGTRGILSMMKPLGTGYGIDLSPVLSYCSHQRVLSVSTNITAEIYVAACGLFDELWDKRPIRHLGIHTSWVFAGDYKS